MADEWGDGPITRERADAFASRVPGVTLSERAAVAHDLAAFPIECRVRGVFFEGLSRVVTKAKSTTMNDLFAIAGVSPRKVAFSLYPHRDFYRLFFLAARALHPAVPLADGMGQVAKTFYPIFRESMVGRTMSAFIGSDPKSLLARLADAYKLSVPWNEHAIEVTSPREVLWTCRVEPTTYYRQIFTGIVSGAIEAHGADAVRIDALRSNIERSAGNHLFRISWA